MNLEAWEYLDSSEKYIASSIGRIFNTYMKKFSKQTTRSDGYVRTTINYKTVYVHRVIAKAFIPNPLNKPQVAHKDGNPQNNQISNLCWATAKENCNMKKNHGTYQIGSKNSYAKLNEEKVKIIRNLLVSGEDRKNIYILDLVCQMQH